MQNNPQGIAFSIVKFVQFARSKGLAIGINEDLEAMEVALLGLIWEKDKFYYGLKALFCNDLEDLPLFDEVFENYWGTATDLDKHLEQAVVENKKNKVAKQSTSVFWGEAVENEDKQDSERVSGANKIERLQKTDFDKLSEMDTLLLQQLAEKMWREMAKRLKKKLKIGNRKKRLDLKNTIRHNLQFGGEPIDLVYKNTKPHRHRLVVLLDVSGSMDRYSFFLLRLVHILQDYFEQVESFVFSTSLLRITDMLRKKGIEPTLKNLSQQIDNWSSGTKIGESLRDFNEKYAKKALAHSSIVIILSDGLDTGEAGIIEEEMTKIQQKTKRLIWLNPLKGNPKYEPLTRGMREAMPSIDYFQSCHNLQSIMALEEILTSV